SWIKNNAKWWADGSIGDKDFVNGIQYLIQQGVMKVPPTQPGTSTSQTIPSWIKNNAKWWADGSIGDKDFVNGIQYLIQQGIIKV
ncbi:MAG: peptidase, partial [Candidatus Nitrosotenuis sp.]